MKIFIGILGIIWIAVVNEGKVSYLLDSGNIPSRHARKRIYQREKVLDLFFGS